MPWGVAAAAIGAGASIYSASKAKKQTDRAAERETEAAEAGLAAQQQAFQEAKGALTPYARQEQVASSQLMAQMGLTPPAAGTGGAAMGGGWGFGEAAPGAAGQQSADMQRFMEDLITEQIAIAGRAGYGGNKNPGKAIAQGSRMAQSAVQQLKREGKLPADFAEPSMEDWNQMGSTAVEAGGGLKGLRRNVALGVDAAGSAESYGQLAERYFPGGQAVQPGGPGGQVPGGQMIDPETGEVTQVGGPAPAGPQAMGAGDVMGLAGVEAMPPELREQYIADLMEDPRADPELAAYLGLTPESLQVGSEYQDTPAYRAAQEMGIEAVNTGAAGTGSLYSGRRGRELRDVGQEVEQGYYTDAMNRRAAMMGARRGERTGGIARRGAAYESDEQRKQSYYNNYMQQLAALASPATTSNIAAMGTSLGKETSANLMDTARSVSDLKIGGQGAINTAVSDVGSGLMKWGASYI